MMAHWPGTDHHQAALAVVQRTQRNIAGVTSDHKLTPTDGHAAGNDAVVHVRRYELHGKAASQAVKDWTGGGPADTTVHPNDVVIDVYWTQHDA